MEQYGQFDSMQLDVLREIGNIGAGNAATALADILTDRVMITVPNLHIVDVNEITKLLGGPEQEVVGLLVNMTDDVEGMLLFILEKDFTHLLINILLSENIKSFENITDMGMSALMEVGNILSGSYISALSSLTGLDIRLSTPMIAVDMLGAILSYPAAQFGLMSEKLLFIEEDFLSGEQSVKSHLLIMPKMDSLDTIMKKLGVN